MQLCIDRQGCVRFVYTDAIDLTSLGPPTIRRASSVEPDARGHWHADLSPVGGPVLGPFLWRCDALHAERCWLAEHWLWPAVDG
ncbi:MAG: hypothetical protein ACYC0X_07830 [Pirellulaceae bacterium]